MKKQNRDGLYAALNTDSVKVRDGAEADPAFGRNHPIISAMGFVREDERRSGLTRKKTTPVPKG